MILVTDKAVNVLKVDDESFKGRDGDTVNFRTATILDDDGNFFKVTLTKDSQVEKGENQILTFVAEYNDYKRTTRIRLD